jgi:oligopeptide transport system ATP-binding protein
MARQINENKLSVQNLSVSFRTTQGYVRAVRDISFDLTAGETLAIVGESGSGKSVTSRAIMGILEKNAVINSGKIIYENEDILTIREEDFHKLRGNKIGMIFQDPLSSLNPIMRIGKQVTEGMIVNGKHLKNKIKALSHEQRREYLNLKEDLLTLKEDFKAQKETLKKEDQKDKISALQSSLDGKVKVLKPKIAEAKAAYIAAKADAKKSVGAEWQAEKAKANEKIAAVKARLASASADDKKALKDEIEHLKEQLRRVKRVTQKEADERAIQVMAEVGIPEPVKRLKQYPFQFSGGMRQRIVIAIALTANPDLLICDEPTTALDVTIQAQILELINKLKRERGLTVIFITHDLGVVANMADRVGVMYAGKIVEIGKSEEIFYNPKHPYTWALLSSMPDLSSKERLSAIPGTPPNMLFPPKGDAFADRNNFAMKIDFEKEPPFFKVSDTHYAATWLLHEDAPKVEMPAIIQERINAMKERTAAASDAQKKNEVNS